MNFKSLFFLGLIAFAFGACSDDDDNDGPSNMELLTNPTWVVRAYSDAGVVETITVDDCDYDDTIKLTAETITIDNNDDTACGGTADEIPFTFPYTYDEANSLLITTVFGDPDTLSVTRLTTTELWLNDTGDFESRYEVQ